MTEMYVRSGECNRCGDCCKGNPFTGEPGGYCPLFAWASEGVGHCTDRRHRYYLSGCNVWPTHPDQIADKPNCSYTFARVG
jgi:hypothetical protein